MQHDEPTGDLVRSLLNPAVWPESPAQVSLVETHISWVFLAGDFAYKIKKPVDFGFLDFSSLEKRRHFCQEELRLNARFAPELYLAVVAVCGTPQHPVIGGDGAAFEYAVKMRRFDQGGLLSNNLAQLDAALIDQLARQVAVFHQGIGVCDPQMPWGSPDALVQPVMDNFRHIRDLGQTAAVLERLDRLETWAGQQAGSLQQVFARRKASGFVRECHGDLHLGNITLIDGRPVLFDGIEFNPALRWIDTMNEIAFLMMDLQEKGLPELASRFLNRYLEDTGDYAGLEVLRFYQMYRAMVRAKVAALRTHQEGSGASADEFSAYLQQAERYTGAPSAALLISFGPSGSGKSYAAGQLAEQLPAVRLRSDVERKRLAGLQAAARTGADLGEGIYGADSTRKTYGRLLELAELVTAAGYRAIVDATFLRREQRQPFMALAQRLGVPFGILHSQAPEPVLRERVRSRLARGNDPSEADEQVLDQQLRTMEPLDGEEAALAIGLETASDLSAADVLRQLAGQRPG